MAGNWLDEWRLRKLDKQFESQADAASSFDEWLTAAGDYDRQSGGEDWRQRDQSRLYDHAALDARLRKLRRIRKRGDDVALLDMLDEGIHGNIDGIGKSQLYARARCGTKLLIEEYIQEVDESLEHLSRKSLKTIPWGERVEFFQRASHCYGRSALMLSGGGTLGYFHFGVLKALIEQKLCPIVISGASAGSFVAAIVGTRTDAEFLALFENDELAKALTRNRGQMKFGLGRSNKVDMAWVKREMARNIPDMTFREAYEKTGRSINITISPAEAQQTSRLLNHIASPNVTIRSAVLASSALPGVFPAVQLEARGSDGRLKPYLPSRRWIDGSLSQDLPAKRLARMYGVNHFLVSQVMPGIGRERNLRPGVRKIASDATVAATKEAVRGTLDFIQRRRRVTPAIGASLNALSALIDQRFTGDINIFPGYGMGELGKILKMLDETEMVELIAAGERATWPKLPNIRQTTRVGRTLDRILHQLEVEEAHWLRSAPSGDAAPEKPKRAAPERKPRASSRARRKLPAKARISGTSAAQKVAARKTGAKAARA